MSPELQGKSHIRRSVDIQVAKSKDTGMVKLKTTVTTTDNRDEIPYLSQSDGLRDRDNKKWKERFKSWGFAGTSTAAFLGGVGLIITGFENIDPEKIIIGAAALVLSKYLLGSAKYASAESGLVSEEMNKIKHVK